MSIINQNLLKEALDEKGRRSTLLDDEKCKYCGAELRCSPSAILRYNSICGCCNAESRRLRKLRCKIVYGRYCKLDTCDPALNSGHGKTFFKAFDRAFGLRESV